MNSFVSMFACTRYIQTTDTIYIYNKTEKETITKKLVDTLFTRNTIFIYKYDTVKQNMYIKIIEKPETIKTNTRVITIPQKVVIKTKNKSNNNSKVGNFYKDLIIFLLLFLIIFIFIRRVFKI